MTTCTKRYDNIPFAHRLANHSGHCRKIHGHNWSVEFEFSATERDTCGFVIDFGSLSVVKSWLMERFDHALLIEASDPELNTWIALEKQGLAKLLLVPDASCEGMAEYIFNHVGLLVKEDSASRVALTRVTLFETSVNSATYKPAAHAH